MILLILSRLINAAGIKTGGIRRVTAPRVAAALAASSDVNEPAGGDREASTPPSPGENCRDCREFKVEEKKKKRVTNEPTGGRRGGEKMLLCGWMCCFLSGGLFFFFFFF